MVHMCPVEQLYMCCILIGLKVNFLKSMKTQVCVCTSIHMHVHAHTHKHTHRVHFRKFEFLCTSQEAKHLIQNSQAVKKCAVFQDVISFSQLGCFGLDIILYLCSYASFCVSFFSYTGKQKN